MQRYQRDLGVISTLTSSIVSKSAEENNLSHPQDGKQLQEKDPSLISGLVKVKVNKTTHLLFSNLVDFSKNTMREGDLI